MRWLRCFVMLLVALTSATAWAKPRTVSDMRRAAERVLTHLVDARAERDKPEIITLEQRGGLVVMGYEEGGYAIVADDDDFPAVLGYSASEYNPRSDNDNFLWWMKAMEKVVSRKQLAGARTVIPAELGLPDHAEKLLSSKWSQSSPFNMFCPGKMATGCVATAASQVLRYFEWPVEGKGTVFTYVPFARTEGTRYEATLDGSPFRYDLMLDHYGVFSPTEAKEAVAALNYHVGLAMKAIYEIGGTGAYSETLTYALRTNLGYPLAVTIGSGKYTADEWMTLIYQQLSDSIPIIYGGTDETYAGHEFVLDGYDENGLVSINWGWGGEGDGYYDLHNLVLHGFYDFSCHQDMVFRCAPRYQLAEQVVVALSAPGTLHEHLTEEQQKWLSNLKVTGPVNGTDIATLRAMAGCDADGKGTWGNLSFLDLGEARIVAGGEPYIHAGPTALVPVADNVMPERAFSDCSFLIDVVLPANLKGFEDGVFANCSNLDHVSLTPDGDADFVVDGSFVMSRDRKELIACLPGCGDDLQYDVPEGVTTIHQDAFAGLPLYERLVLPATLERVGPRAFNRCFDLYFTYLKAEEPPAIDPSAIDPLDLSLRTLYVPKGSRFKYQRAEGWKKYERRIIEYDFGEAGISLPVRQETGNQRYDLMGRRAVPAAKGMTHGIVVSKGRKEVR